MIFLQKAPLWLSPGRAALVAGNGLKRQQVASFWALGRAKGSLIGHWATLEVKSKCS